MKTVLPLFMIAYGVVAGLFGIAGVVLMGFAFLELWAAVIEPEGQTLPARAAIAIESIGLVAVALVALEMSQTVAEEEVVRRVHVSAPTRVRRYLSRFLVVVVVALGIESLVAVVQALHERPETLPNAASVAIGAAALLAAWGVFVRLNRTVEELEPQGVQEARAEDHKVNENVIVRARDRSMTRRPNLADDQTSEQTHGDSIQPSRCTDETWSRVVPSSSTRSIGPV